MRRNLGQPDGDLHRFQLTEERPHAGKVVMPPVLQQAGGFRSDVPLGWVGNLPLEFDQAAQTVDLVAVLVLLSGGGQAFAFVQRERLLLLLLLFGLGDRTNKLRQSPGFDDFLGRLAGGIQLPMPRRPGIWGVENRRVEERIGHADGPARETVDLQ